MSPFEWIVSRICEEFHCRPTEAMQELRDDRWRLTFAILEMRAYAHAKHPLGKVQATTLGTTFYESIAPNAPFLLKVDATGRVIYALNAQITKELS